MAATVPKGHKQCFSVGATETPSGGGTKGRHRAPLRDDALCSGRRVCASVTLIIKRSVSSRLEEMHRPAVTARPCNNRRSNIFWPNPPRNTSRNKDAPQGLMPKTNSTHCCFDKNGHDTMPGIFTLTIR